MVEYKSGDRRKITRGKDEGKFVFFGFKDANGKNQWYPTKKLAIANRKRTIVNLTEITAPGKKRPPSVYNLFVKRYLKGKTGDMAKHMKEAAKAWKKTALGNAYATKRKTSKK